MLKRPFIPNINPVTYEVRNIGIPLEKPEQFVDNTFEMNLLGSEERKAFAKVATKLVTKNAPGTGTSAITFIGTIL